MNILRSILPHIIIILSGIFITLLILDNYNPTMNFINNSVSRKLFWFFCILSILDSIITIIIDRREWKKKYTDRLNDKEEHNN